MSCFLCEVPHSARVRNRVGAEIDVCPTHAELAANYGWVIVSGLTPYAVDAPMAREATVVAVKDLFDGSNGFQKPRR